MEHVDSFSLGYATRKLILLFLEFCWDYVVVIINFIVYSFDLLRQIDLVGLNLILKLRHLCHNIFSNSFFIINVLFPKVINIHIFVTFALKFL